MLTSERGRAGQAGIVVCVQRFPRATLGSFGGLGAGAPPVALCPWQLAFHPLDASCESDWGPRLFTHRHAGTAAAAVLREMASQQGSLRLSEACPPLATLPAPRHRRVFLLPDTKCSWTGIGCERASCCCRRCCTTGCAVAAASSWRCCWPQLQAALLTRGAPNSPLPLPQSSAATAPTSAAPI
jgi:hypothetical protein